VESGHFDDTLGAMLMLNMLVFAFAKVSPTTEGDSPRLVGDSSYVSVEANEHNIRSRIDVYGPNFTMRAIGADPNTGAGSHDGGLITIEEQDSFYRLRNIGIYLPKPGITEWASGELHCERLDVTDDIYSSACIRGERRFSYIVSKSRGVLSFTGFCFIATDRLCQYVLISESGIAHR
jgi:hypothetical protein